MKLRSQLFILLTSLFLFPGFLNAAFAELLSLQHDCGQGGAVSFSLNGNPDAYTYFWTHGPEKLKLDNLSPGVYTLVVRDFYGCEETYDVEILSLGGCQLSYQVLNTLDPCVAFLELTVLTSAGQLIAEEALSIIWGDGNTSGLSRQISLVSNNNYNVNITLAGDTGGSCCNINESIFVAGSPSCSYDCDKQVIVNETNRFQNGTGQYVELLVTGNCECGGTTNLQGMIVDDNNGLLIPANEFAMPYNLESGLGINMGYLSFAYDTNWENVPNGSLIIIYDQRDGTVPGLPSDDPTDANQDSVYVLPASDSNYLFAKTGDWDPIINEMTYTGMLTTPAWESIKLSPEADGMQIRIADGTFHHGVSTGETSYSGENDFPIWLGVQNISNSNVQWTGLNYDDKNDFTFSDADLLNQTPGLPNSQDNADFIAQLKDCGVSMPLQSPSNPPANAKKNSTINTVEEKVQVFPNPFTQTFNLSFYAAEAGLAKLKIFNTAGQILHRDQLPTNAGMNTHQVKTNTELPTGLLILEFEFPSGAIRQVKITHAQMN